jgi:hypothetical protein
MKRKDKKPSSVNNVEIAVFEFSKGSQINSNMQKGECYNFMLNMIGTLMKNSNVQSDRIGITGFKEDVASYLSTIMAIYYYKDIDIDLKEDSSEFI